MEDAQGILDAVDVQILRNADDRVKMFGVCKAVCPQTLPELDETALKKAMQTYEIALTDLWYTTQNSGPPDRRDNAFGQMCKKCVDIMQAIKIPTDVVQMYFHILKLVSYACLGDRPGDAKRYLNCNKDAWSAPTHSADWNHRVLGDICRAIVHLVKKESLDEIVQVGAIIKNLRADQKVYEQRYLDGIKSEQSVAVADELAALYHLAKSVELASTFMMQGMPADAEEQVDFHFKHAKTHAQSSGYIEMDIILFVLCEALKKIMRNSVWDLARAVPNLEGFIKKLTQSERPVFEFMYPQKTALDDGLLDPAKMAVVVNLPTSSGKTLMAEFRILQALDVSKDAKVAYIVPTKTLANQITARLKRDLGSRFKIEKMSGAAEIGGFEDEIVRRNDFEILVTTPEKLQMLIRSTDNEFAKHLVLTIVDEAHNLADSHRGFNLEMLLSTIKHDCRRSHFLLMSPAIPNSSDLAEWLYPSNSKAISMEVDWTPNDRVIGTYYYKGTGRDISTYFVPLIDGSKNDISIDEIMIKRIQDSPYTASTMSQYQLTALVAAQLDRSQNLLVLATSIDDTWKIADAIVKNFHKDHTITSEIQLVMRYVTSEMGNDFPLNRYLKKGVAVHHAGLPDDIRGLVEWLMENGHIRVLVATSTISEGINFPVSGILMNSYKYYNPELHRKEPMPANDFWNIVGRVGRVDQPSIGMVGIASCEGDTGKVMSYVKAVTDDLVSHMVKMVEDACKANMDLNLSDLAGDPNWSKFLQYIAHIKNQSESLEHFEMRIDSTLGKTYGYGSIRPDARMILKNAVRRYAQKLDDTPDISRISDMTGFAPENIDAAILEMNRWQEKMQPEDWLSERLFAAQSKMSDLIMLMANTIPETSDVRKWMNKDQKDAVQAAQLVTDWVSGMTIKDIAARHFADREDGITDCVRTIYKIISNAITWGVAGIQRIPGSGTECMTDDARMQASNIPAMIHYGVSTKEAILMCMNGVPRRIAPKIGRMYKDAAAISDISKWLDGLPDYAWEYDDYTDTDHMSGKDRKTVWQILSGMYLAKQ